MQDRTLGVLLIILALGGLVGVGFWVRKTLAEPEAPLSEPNPSSSPDDIQAQIAFKATCLAIAAQSRIRGVTYRNWKRQHPNCAAIVSKAEYVAVLAGEGESTQDAADRVQRNFGQKFLRGVGQVAGATFKLGVGAVKLVT